MKIYRREFIKYCMYVGGALLFGIPSCINKKPVERVRVEAAKKEVEAKPRAEKIEERIKEAIHYDDLLKMANKLYFSIEDLAKTYKKEAEGLGVKIDKEKIIRNMEFAFSNLVRRPEPLLAVAGISTNKNRIMKCDFTGNLGIRYHSALFSIPATYFVVNYAYDHYGEIKNKYGEVPVSREYLEKIVKSWDNKVLEKMECSIRIASKDPENLGYKLFFGVDPRVAKNKNVNKIYKKFPDTAEKYESLPVEEFVIYRKDYVEKEDELKKAFEGVVRVLYENINNEYYKSAYKSLMNYNWIRMRLKWISKNGFKM